MKKIYSLLLVLCLIFLLSACGGNETATDNDTGSFCTECGEEISATDKFCGSCGASVEKSTTDNSTTNTTQNNDSSNSDSIDVPSSTTSKPTTTTKPETSKPTTTTKPSTPTHTHSYSGATCTTPAKCSCGATNGSALGHSYNNATCTEPQKCSRCGETDDEALGHSFNNGCCTRCGFVKFETLKFSGSNQGIVAENINLPKGQYRVLISFEGTDPFELENYSGGWINVHLNGDSYEESFSSVNHGSAKATIIDGPVNNGYILIDGHEGNWKITIEAFK